MIATKAIPPTTPPAMADTFGPELEGAGFGSRAHTIRAQVLQSVGIKVQISFLLHVGHDGWSPGQSRQRLKTVRRVRSTSDLRVMERRATGMGVVEAMGRCRSREPAALAMEGSWVVRMREGELARGSVVSARFCSRAAAVEAEAVVVR